MPPSDSAASRSPELLGEPWLRPAPTTPEQQEAFSTQEPCISPCGGQKQTRKCQINQAGWSTVVLLRAALSW